LLCGNPSTSHVTGWAGAADMTDTQRYSILITDDDRGVREALGEIVEARGLRPVLAEDGEHAIEIVRHEPVHLALLDYQMPRLTGLETLQLVRQFNALLPATSANSV